MIRAAVRPADPDAVSTPRPRTVTGTRRPALLRSTAQVAAGLDEPDTLLVNVLALLGRDDVAVYDGSMTAWAADPEQPPVVGDSPR